VATASTSATPARLRVQYSTDQTTWLYLDGTAGPSVDLNAAGLQVSPWVNVAAGARAEVFIRVVGLDGNASTAVVGNIEVQAK
jgi:hypothetical protein